MLRFYIIYTLTFLGHVICMYLQEVQAIDQIWVSFYALINPCSIRVCQCLINTHKAREPMKLTDLTLRDVRSCNPTAWMNYKQRARPQSCCYPGLLANVVKCALKRKPDPIWCPLSPEAADVQMVLSLSRAHFPSLSRMRSAFSLSL